MRCVSSIKHRQFIFVVSLLGFLSLAIARVLAADARSRSIDTGRSSITIHVYKAGVFSAFGHEHEIHATIQRGTIDDAQRTIEFVVDSRSLRVMDHDASEKDRAEIQSTMLGPKVLDTDKFPEIRFRATKIEALDRGKWIVHGELTLHGLTHPVLVNVEDQSGRFLGAAKLLQRDFGIIPVSVAGGSIKVKDEVKVEFEIFEKPGRE